MVGGRGGGRRARARASSATPDPILEADIHSRGISEADRCMLLGKKPHLVGNGMNNLRVPEPIVLRMPVPKKVGALVYRRTHQECQVFLAESVEVEAHDLGARPVHGVHSVPIHEVPKRPASPIGAEIADPVLIEGGQNLSAAVIALTKGGAGPQLGPKAGQLEHARRRIGHQPEDGRLGPARGTSNLEGDGRRARETQRRHHGADRDPPRGRRRRASEGAARQHAVSLAIATDGAVVNDGPSGPWCDAVSREGAPTSKWPSLEPSLEPGGDAADPLAGPDDRARPGPPRALNAVLSVRRPGLPEVKVPVTSGLVIGRSPALADLVLDDELVSRRHARVHVDTRGYFRLDDLGSRNGIRFADRTVRRLNLVDGDTFCIGKTELTFSAEMPRFAAATPEPPPRVDTLMVDAAVPVPDPVPDPGDGLEGAEQLAWKRSPRRGGDLASPSPGSAKSERGSPPTSG